MREGRERPQRVSNSPQAETKWFSLALFQILAVIKAQEDRHTHTQTHKCTHMVRSGEEHPRLPLQISFWPGGVHVNSRGKTLTDFQDLLQVRVTSSCRDGWCYTQIAHVHTHASVRFWRPYKGIIYYLWLAKDSYKIWCQIYTTSEGLSSADLSYHSLRLPINLRTLSQERGEKNESLF